MAWKKTKNQSNQSRLKPSKRPKTLAPINQTFMQHIAELRKRLFWTALIGLGIGTIVTIYYDAILHVVLAPYGNQKLIYLTVGGGFSFIFSVILYVALIGIMPFLLYQIYAFMKPAIPRAAQIGSIKVALLALVLMVGGVSFGYFVAIPRGLEFLTTFASDVVESTLTADSYLNFVFGYAFGLGLLFELPLILMLWHWISPLSMKKLLLTERYIILVAFILAAVISPTPDALNQSMIAVPIIIIYQLGVVVVWLSIRKKNKLAKKAAAQAASVPPPPPPQVPPSLPPSAPQPMPVVQRSQSQRPAIAMSLDGFRPQHMRTANTLMMQKTLQASRPVSTSSSLTSDRQPMRRQLADRGKVAVPRRNPMLISDFGPIRRSAIDSTR